MHCFSFVSTEPPDQLAIGDFAESRNKKSLVVWLIRRRFYVFIFLMLSAVAWLLIYYKVLDHRFELPGPLRELQRFFGDGDAKHRRRLTQDYEWELIFNVTRGRNRTRSSYPVHIGIVACTGREHDALMSLGMLARVSHHVMHFHIFAERPAVFEEALMKWEGWLEDWMEFETYPLQYPWHENSDFWKEVTCGKLCENQLLFVPNILSDLDAIIFIETDALFLRAPEDLWQLLHVFNDSQMFGIPYGNEDISGWHPHSDSSLDSNPASDLERLGVNTGVMLLNLTRLRMYELEARVRNLLESCPRPACSCNTREIIFTLCKQDPGILYRLPCFWNYGPDNCEKENNCVEAKKHGIAAVQRCREKWRSHSKSQIFEVIYQAVRDFEGSGNFSDAVVLRIDRKFRRMRRSGCSKMKNEFMKYLRLID